jgi:hypothetical protein
MGGGEQASEQCAGGPAADATPQGKRPDSSRPIVPMRCVSCIPKSRFSFGGAIRFMAIELHDSWICKPDAYQSVPHLHK